METLFNIFYQQVLLIVNHSGCEKYRKLSFYLVIFRKNDAETHHSLEHIHRVSKQKRPTSFKGNCHPESLRMAINIGC